MRTTLAALALVLIALPIPGTARDDRLKFPIKRALSQPEAVAKLKPDVAFYFAGAPHPEVLEKLGETVVNLKTNAFGKSDQAACEWVLLSVAIELQKRAREAGGNAVIGIESYYKKELFRSETEYMCGAGAMVAGATLRGEIVKLAPAPAGEAKPAAPAEAKPAQ